MTPELASQPQPLRPGPSGFAAVGPAGASASTARRRRALLQLARRHGEVRVALRDASGLNPTACPVVELLDELNAGGLLRYGGLQRAGATVEILYHPA